MGHGGTVLAPPLDVGSLGRTAILADPAGAVFMVLTPPASGPVPDRTG